jgi:hypothetical protein
MRPLFESATYTRSAPSTATPYGRANCPGREPFEPQLRIHAPAGENFAIRLFA